MGNIDDIDNDELRKSETMLNSGLDGDELEEKFHESNPLGKGEILKGKEIRITCKVYDSVSINDLNILQGDLKEFSEEAYHKLRKNIIELGFSFPFFVWDDGEKLNLLDGTHRKITVDRMKLEGFIFPDKLPIVRIFAKNLQEAKRKLLASTSSFAKITEKGFLEFVNDIDFDRDDFDLSFELEGIDFDNLDFSSSDVSGNDEESDVDPDEYEFKYECPKCGFQFNKNGHSETEV